jgi:hypothetical protein
MSLPSLLPPGLFVAQGFEGYVRSDLAMAPRSVRRLRSEIPWAIPHGVVAVSRRDGIAQARTEKSAHRDQTCKNDDRHEILSFGALVGLSSHCEDHHSETTVKKS